MLTHTVHVLKHTLTSSQQENIIKHTHPVSLKDTRYLRIIFNSCKNTQKKSGGRLPPMNTNCVCRTSYKEVVHQFMWSCYCAARDPCENVMVARLWIRCQRGGLQLLEGRRGAERCWWMNIEWEYGVVSFVYHIPHTGCIYCDVLCFIPL